MNIKQTPLFSHAFPLGKMGSGEEFNQIKVWCTSNCNGRWLVIDSSAYNGGSVNLTYYSKALHDSPVKGIEYPPAEIRSTSNRIISFEEETDAMAFKLYFEEPEEIGDV